MRSVITKSEVDGTYLLQQANKGGSNNEFRATDIFFFSPFQLCEVICGRGV